MWNQELTEDLQNKLSEICKTKSTLIFFRQYLGCWSCRYAIDK